MADSIFADGPLDAPEAYHVPGSAEIIPLSVAALFDGTNASAAFVPVLIFRDQQGNVIARVPTETTVSAGASAEVSWFPGVKRGGGATTAATAWARATIGVFDSHTNVPPRSSIFLPFAHFQSSDTSIIDMTALSNPMDAFNLQAQGIYYLSGAVQWAVDAFDRYAIWDTGATQADAHGVTGANASTGALFGSLGTWWDHDTATVVPESPPTTASLRVFNGHAANTEHVTVAFASVYYWPNPVPSSPI